jgi:hypothetical protein
LDATGRRGVTTVRPRAVEHEGRTFVVPAATVALDRGERLALATVTGNAFEYGGRQIVYDLSPGAVDLSLARSGRCPLLAEHLPHLHALLGSVAGAAVEGDELRCLCRFARTPQADEVWHLLEQGFPLSISAGGLIQHAEQAGEGMIHATRWQLVEVSVVVRGRDEAASIRKLEIDEDAAEMVARMNVDDPDGLGRRVALRRKYRLDDWSRWTQTAGPRLARMLDVGADEATDALGELVREQILELEAGLA